MQLHILHFEYVRAPVLGQLARERHHPLNKVVGHVHEQLLHLVIERLVGINLLDQFLQLALGEHLCLCFESFRLQRLLHSVGLHGLRGCSAAHGSGRRGWCSGWRSRPRGGTWRAWRRTWHRRRCLQPCRRCMLHVLHGLHRPSLDRHWRHHRRRRRRRRCRIHHGRCHGRRSGLGGQPRCCAYWCYSTPGAHHRRLSLHRKLGGCRRYGLSSRRR
mmetsp:Transcript_77/g.171  ORF Transcript_77/g.171 Transcript_77/m.171 type:complete len:216 (+) Transcript_77:372-1019(+)